MDSLHVSPAPIDAARSDFVHVLFVSDSLLGFAGSSRRYRRYFPLMRQRGVLPRIVTLPPREHKRFESTPIPAGRGWIWRTDVDGTPTTVVRTAIRNPVLRFHLLFCRVLWESATQRGQLTLHVLQQAKRKTFLHALLLRLSRRQKVLSVTKDIKLRRGARKRWVQRVHFNTFDTILCQSENQATTLRSMGVRADVHQIPNGVDTARYRPVDAPRRRALRLRLGLPADEPVFVYTGSVQPRKGTDLLLEAWRELRARGIGGRLLVIGPRYDLVSQPRAEFSARLDDLLAKPGMAESVTFTGVLPEVREYLLSADGFVFPSRREGVPNAVLEAMACGLPCVLTPFSKDMSQFGRPGEHFLLCEREPQALAAAMAEIAGDADRARATYGVRARTRMLDTMDLDRAVDLHCKVFRSLLDRRRAEPRR